MGNITKLIFYFLPDHPWINDSDGEEMLELEESMRAEKDFNNHFAKTVLLSENCEVLHEENVAFYRKESALQEQLVMNQLGHLLQIHTIKCVAESKTEVQPHKHPLNDSQVTYVAIPSESRL